MTILSIIHLGLWKSKRKTSLYLALCVCMNVKLCMLIDLECWWTILRCTIQKCLFAVSIKQQQHIPISHANAHCFYSSEYLKSWYHSFYECVYSCTCCLLSWRARQWICTYITAPQQSSDVARHLNLPDFFFSN